ncbi:permease prefix domain 1-containing protein [Flavonifractor sp. HCP28S3_F3]|uniref:permease prefix domain 1-containing protein n=1 Tax=Flavonifractor sp. HCP28S3_F3 TaxID=3438939 RepID=UPI003F8CA35D
MSSKSSYTFCTQVCSVIRWKPAREAAWKELLAHLEDHAAALQEQGVPADEAITQAVEAMGDPYEIGHQLDHCHSPLVPRLSRIFILLAAAVLVLGLVIGFRNDTGIFALTGLLPHAADLPYGGDGTVEISGAASGGGKLAGYTLTPSGQAGLVLVSWESPEGVIDSEYQLQCPVTIHKQPWCPPIKAYQANAAWTDDTGASGLAYFSTYYEDALLGSTAWLRIVEPTPGSRKFTVTLSSTEEAVTIYVTLQEEVPAA